MYKGPAVEKAKQSWPNLKRYMQEQETLIMSEVSQKEKDKYHMISPISGI